MSQQPTILLIDEDTTTLEKLQTALQRRNYRVVVAANEQAALRLSQTVSPNLIVSDLVLAGTSIYEVWRTIQTGHQVTHIPVIVISALNIPPSNTPWRPTATADWQLISYDAALPKPVDIRRFMNVVERLLKPEQAGSIHGGPSLILATADPELRVELTAILKGYDFGVEAPPSINVAFQLAQGMPPAALLLDCRGTGQIMKSILLQAENLPADTLLIPLIDPDQLLETELRTRLVGYLTTPLHPIHTVTGLNQLLELHNLRQRNQLLSEHLLANERNLLDTQESLQAQSKELAYAHTRLRETDDQKDTYTSLMVHDLKSPLGSILGTLNFLITDPNLNFSGITENLLQGAIAAGNQMLRLVESILEGQRIILGHFEAYPEPFEIPAVIDISIEQIMPFLILHNLKLERTVADNLPLVYADISSSQRLVENLLDNAIKYSPAHSTIRINADTENGFVRVSVEDQGPGIPAEQQADIFDRLGQLKAGKKSHPRSGFGMGLTFCRLAAEAMGGKIWVESSGEIGAKFVFTLPIYTD